MKQIGLTLAMLLMCLPARGEAWQVVGGGDKSLIFDSFSEQAVTPLASHSPEIGSAWVFDTAIGGSAVEVTTTGAAKNTAATASFAYNTLPLSSPNYSMSARVIYLSTGGYSDTGGPCIRMTGEGGGYCTRVDPNNGRLYIFKKASGNSSWDLTSLGYINSGVTIATLTEYVLKLSGVGSTITATISDDAGTILSTNTKTDSTYGDAGHAGFYIGPNTVFQVREVYAE